MPQPPKGVACVFCNHLDHFSGDCPKHTSLSDRVEILKDHMLCCNCLRQHRGECVRRDPCSRCNREGHHRAVCIDNPTVVIDVRGTKDHIYEQMADYTYRPYPRDVTPPQKHPLPRKLADRARQETERTRTSHRPPTQAQHQEPSTSGYARRPASRASIQRRQQEPPTPVRRDSRPRFRTGGFSPPQESRASPQAPRQYRPSFRNFCRSSPRAPSPARREASPKDEDELNSGGGSW
ncbi:unnamed protein product [Heligmosomoides polygyrus]|uniref:CCHC-type domain-containing protein n=1 Tax=Heligmosomoides polygyrus TaxID=6339 RepID=A0A3P8C8Q8_HELPZ|nr:unnamed protein product [Heligmosomoides polygyrus]